MSQLDITISFSHFFGLILCFYIFLHYIVIIILKFLYNHKLRSLEYEEYEELEQLNKIDNSIFIKKILKL